MSLAPVRASHPARVVSTHPIADADARHWSRFLSDTLCVPGPGIQGERQFSAHARGATFGGVHLFQMRSTPHVVDCPFRRWQDDKGFTEHYVECVFQLEGHTTVHLNDTRLDVQQGQWLLNVSAEPCRIVHDGHTQQLLLLMPWAEVFRDRALMMQLTRRALPAQSGAARVLMDLAVSALQQSEQMETASRQALAPLLRQLLVTAVGELAVRSPVLDAKARLVERIRRVVEARLGDALLSIDDIAQACGCSKRYLHIAFAQHSEGGSLTQYILTQRLTACKNELAQIEPASRSIAEVAYRWGFTDPAHFSRAFRKAYGITPTAFRAICQTPQPED